MELRQPVQRELQSVETAYTSVTLLTLPLPPLSPLPWSTLVLTIVIHFTTDFSSYKFNALNKLSKYKQIQNALGRALTRTALTQIEHITLHYITSYDIRLPQGVVLRRLLKIAILTYLTAQITFTPDKLPIPVYLPRRDGQLAQLKHICTYIFARDHYTIKYSGSSGN